MSNNTRLNKGEGGDLIATELIDDVKHQLVKMQYGEPGIAINVSGSNPMPTINDTANALLTTISQTTQPLTDAQLRASRVPMEIGSGDLQIDAWGSPKVSVVRSLDHGLFTYDISPLLWFIYQNGVQVYTSTNVVSTNGEAIVTGNAAVPLARLESRLCPRYQPNRGHLFSTALWMPNKLNDGIRRFGLGTNENRVYFKLTSDGKVYACLRSNNVETYEQEVITTGVANFDVEKGNVYDVQYQWRGVGNYYFYINLQLVHVISNLGTLTALSLANPALPQFFESERITQDVSMYIGCADTSSENGGPSLEQYTAAYSEAVSTTGADKPILVLRNPLLIGGKTNTRTIVISTVKVTSDKKCVVKIWRTRDATGITGATYVANGNGSYVETDSTNMNAGAVRATAVTVAKLQFVSAINLESNVTGEVNLSTDREHIEFSLVRGDYLVVTNNAVSGSATCVLDWGEEI